MNIRLHSSVAGPVLALVLASVPQFAAAADLDTTPASLNIQPEIATTPPAPQQTGEAVTDLELSPAAVAYGTAGSKWWSAGAGIANDFSNATDLHVYGAYSYFLDTDVELAAELGGWYYGQGDDALGLNPNIVFRWHFFNNQKWTVYGDLGIGVLFTTDDVPDGGSSLGFTPRAGFGFTRLLNDSGLRWQTGLRWAHISNARLNGDEDNPSRDSAMLYTGLIWPF